MRVTVWKHESWSRRLILLVVILAALRFAAQAERLPLKSYTTADGLVRDYINRIVRDSHAFLWFCTPEGLSRFDGYSFTNYGAADGLRGSVRDLLEARDGTYWIATASGLYRFDPTPQSKVGPASNIQSSTLSTATAVASRFVLYRPGDNERATSVNIVRQDRSGVIWCGTDAGLYRLDQSQNGWRFTFVDIGLPTNQPDDAMISAILEAHDSSLWIGAESGLYKRESGGGVQRYTTQDGLPYVGVRALLEDRDGALWVGTTQALFQLSLKPDSHKIVAVRSYTTKNGLTHNWVTSLLQTQDGRLWVGTTGGLSEFVAVLDKGALSFRSYTDDQGLSAREVQSLAEDVEGELWIGTDSGGAMKLARSGFTTYTRDDGLNDLRIASIFEDHAGELCVIGSHTGGLFIHRFDGKRFSAIRANLTEPTNFGWGWNQIGFQDHAGEWWLPTIEGLYRFPRANKLEDFARLQPSDVYTTKDGLPNNAVFRLYEDSRHDIWISVISQNPDNLARWVRTTGEIYRYTEADGLPPLNSPTAFREDSLGNLWIGFYSARLARYQNGRFTLFGTADGLPEGMIRDLYFDHKGRLWIAGSRGGVARVENISADRLRFVSYTTSQGLASNEATCITEDQQGRIYVGTPQGVDRMDPDSGHIKHYTVADGLANNFVNVAFRDRSGALWFGTLQGLSRFVPEPESSSIAPSILISGLRIAGIDYDLSPLGQTEIAAPELSANQNDLEIDYSSISVGAAAALRYEYKLEGTDQDWSAPTTQRSISYASLSPGAYRFLVRAVGVDGMRSPKPATVSFRILRPIWQRWWFVTIAALFVLGTASLLYKYRVNHLLEVERVRARIATDLHDDIGASLSRIAILSEVVKLQNDGRNERSARMLTDISDSARSLVDSMSDIVWSIDPRRDDLQSVVRRVRQFAADVLETQGIKWDLVNAAELEQVKLQPEERRHLFLIFKEALTNIARHAGCTTVLVRLTRVGHQLRAEINDDGKGFAAIPASVPGTDGRGGHGVENMRARAAQLGGRLEIDSTAGGGTRLTLTMPLAQQHGMNMLFSPWRK